MNPYDYQLISPKELAKKVSSSYQISAKDFNDFSIYTYNEAFNLVAKDAARRGQDSFKLSAVLGQLWSDQGQTDYPSALKVFNKLIPELLKAGYRLTILSEQVQGLKLNDWLIEW